MPWPSKKIVRLLFCVFQTKLNKTVNNFCELPEWIRNVLMIAGFVQDLDENVDENLACLTQKTADPKM